MTSNSTRTMTGWQAVAEGLKAEGVRYVFGLPGDPKHLYDALVELAPGGPVPIGVRYETSGAFMAMAYTRVTNELAVCFGCPGPGIANLVPGILESFSGCTPMLIIGVRASRQTNGMGAFQETDHIGMLTPITRWATTVETAERIPWTIRRAVQIATTGQRGPVYVELPADIGLGEWDMPPYVPAVRDLRPAPDPKAIAAAVDLIQAAKRPLVIAGGGAILSGAGEAATSLSTEFGLPVQTTPAGRGAVPETHPLFSGLVGLYRTTVPKAIYEESDLLITVGSRMEEFQGGFFPLADGVKIIQIEIEAFEIGRHWRPDVAILADARAAVDALAAELRSRGVRRNDKRADEIEKRASAAVAAARADVEASLATGETPFKGKAIVNEINRVFGENTILAKENGGQDLWAYYWPYYRVLDAGCCVPPAEQTAMGYGVIGAMAAKLAAPDRNVVVTTGDGAFQMACHEIGTAAQNKLGVTWVVLNDGAFGWVQWIQKKELDGRVVATTFDPAIDNVAIAKASGCEAVRVNSAAELSAALEQAKAANARGVPFLIDVPVDQSHHHAEFDRFHGLTPDPSSATV
jgi:acetolactate synthase-1/2/3 large subunit